jgi:hypothetical protein
MSDYITPWIIGIAVWPLILHWITDGEIWYDVETKRDVLLAVFGILLWPLALVSAVLYFIIGAVVGSVGMHYVAMHKIEKKQTKN